MARGRLISKSLSTSEKYARLHVVAGKLAEFCQVLYPLIVAHSDDFGRLAGDPFTVKHLVLPTSPRSVAAFGLALQCLDDVELIRWYEVDGKAYIQVVTFDSHQPGLHNRTKSKLPPPPETRQVPCLAVEAEMGAKTQSSGNSRKFPKIPSELNRTELKRTEEKRSRAGRDKAAPTRALLEYFERKHVEKLDTKPSFNGGKDAAIMARLWRSREGDPITVEALIDAFFASRDPFIVSAGYSVGVFQSQVAKLLSAVQRQTPKSAVPSDVHRLCDAAGLSTFDTVSWFSGAALITDVNTGTVMLSVPDPDYRAYIAKHYADALEAAVVAKGGARLVITEARAA